MKRVSVIIPNWNGVDLIGPCLESLYRQDFDDFEIIVVDNGSRDGSVSFIEEKFPEVTIIQFDENRGFSVAVNAGIIASNSSYIALLNNDTLVQRQWLRELVDALDTNAQLGSVASKILFLSDPTSVNSAGDEFSWFGAAYQRRRTYGDADRFNTPQLVFSACAAAALYRRELFDKIGLFDERFFAYHEDVDLGFRSQLAGFRCLFVPTAVVHHKHRATSARMPDRWFYLRERNKYFVVIKNLPAKLLILCFPLIILQDLCSLFESVWKGYFPAFLRSRLDFCQYLPQMLRERRDVQACRVVRDSYVLGLMRFREPLLIAGSCLWTGLAIKQERIKSIS